MRFRIFFLAVSCLSVILCLNNPPEALSLETVSRPDDVRLSEILAGFEKYAGKAMADWRVPGMAIAIVQGDDVIYKKAFGVKEIGKPDPVTTDTVFQIGSASKAFTAALIAYMVDEGKARWNDRVVSHIKDFRLYDEWVTGQFTVTDLMAQRSGMVEHALDSLIMLGYDPGRVVSSLRYVKPATSFRSSYAYQNNLWLVAARIVEKLTGKGWAENVRDLIFRRLGMSSSSCDKRSFVTAADAATLHHIVDGKIIVLPMGWKYMDWVYDYGPAGGINSNLDDMAKWVRMHLSDGLFDGRRIINEESVRYMRSPQTVISGSSDPAQYYCQGWVHREADPYPVIWHNGGTSGSKTIVAFVPQAKVGIVVLSNLNETKLPESLAFRFFDMYFGNPERDWSKEAFDKDAKAAEKAASEEPVRPKLPLHARPLYKYCGEYANDIFGKVRVSKKGEEIALVIGPKDTAIGLSHWDRDTFMGSWEYFCVGEGTGPVRFSMGPDGEPSGMTIEMLDADGCGTFEKLPSASPPAAYKARKPEATVSFDKCYNEAPLKDGVREITYLKFLQLCASGEKIIVVDVLSPDDYNTGHIPGAISLPVKMINELSAKSKIPPGSAVIVYCLDSHCPYSREAAQKLSGYGYKVLAYKGGLDEWQQKGQKLAR